MAPEVRLSGPDNEPLGIVSLMEALRLAGFKLSCRTKIIRRIDPISGQEIK